MTPIQTLLIAAIAGILAWGLTNGGILLTFLWKSRKIASAIQASFESTFWMCINMVSWMIILAIGVAWPMPQSTAQPVYVQMITMVLFIVGSASISYAQHRNRVIWMGTKRAEG